MSKISICIDTDENSVSTITQSKDSIEIKIENSALSSIQVGELTDKEMRRFSLGPYSKNSMLCSETSISDLSVKSCGLKIDDSVINKAMITNLQTERIDINEVK